MSVCVCVSRVDTRKHLAYPEIHCRGTLKAAATASTKLPKVHQNPPGSRGRAELTQRDQTGESQIQSQ